jgi:hypothetical protein
LECYYLFVQEDLAGAKAPEADGALLCLIQKTTASDDRERSRLEKITDVINIIGSFSRHPLKSPAKFSIFL